MFYSSYIATCKRECVHTCEMTFRCMKDGLRKKGWLALSDSEKNLVFTLIFTGCAFDKLFRLFELIHVGCL